MLEREKLRSRPPPSGYSNLGRDHGHSLIPMVVYLRIRLICLKSMVLLLRSPPWNNSATPIPISLGDWMARKLRRPTMIMPETKPVHFGILGCGSASIPVCEAIAVSPLTNLTAVYDVNQDLANDLSQRFHVRKMETLDELLTNEMVDVIYVAVPHYLLAPLTYKALKAGKH